MNIDEQNWPRDRLPNFKASEFACSHCGVVAMDYMFLIKLQNIRLDYGYPMPIHSGFRCDKHPAEKNKTHGGGFHTKGLAADIGCPNSQQAYKLIKTALKHNITGIGVSLSPRNRTEQRFIHLDIGITRRDHNNKVIVPRPCFWSYH